MRGYEGRAIRAYQRRDAEGGGDSVLVVVVLVIIIILGF